MIVARGILLALLVLLPLPAIGGAQLRPSAGKGVLVIPSAPGPVTAPLYEYAGTRRKGNVSFEELPSLSASIARGKGGLYLATFALREGFARVAVARSGEEGWLELRPGWRFIPWERFLAGRTVRLTAGLRSSAASLRQLPTEEGSVVGTLPPAASPLVDEVRDDWVLIRKNGTISGWLRWRDGDGRLLVTVE